MTEEYTDNTAFSMPAGVLECSRLQHLHITACVDYCTVQPLPEGISRLCSLRSLVLEDACSGQLPAAFTCLTGLTRLSIRGCGHSVRLPPSFRRLQQLKFLELDPQTADAGLTEIANLEHLDEVRLHCMYQKAPSCCSQLAPHLLHTALDG